MLGFIFYKYLSEKEEKHLKNELYFEDSQIEKLTEKDTKTVDNLKNNLGYFIEYKNLFSTWVNKGKKKGNSLLDISDVTKALNAFSRNIGETYKKVYRNTSSDKNEDIFHTLSSGLNDLGSDDASRSQAIRSLVDLVRTIPMDGKEEYDMLGFIYEYLLKNFAANAGKAGEFYTPHEASMIMSEIIADHLKDKEKISIYDPTSGSGSLLINIGKAVEKHMKKKNSVKYYAQELITNTYNLTKMNLVMRDVAPSNIIVRNGDTLKEDWPYFEENDKSSYEPLFVDGCCSNPPYSQAWDIDNQELDKRFKEYGVAPKSKADYAFLLHNLYHLNPDGIMTIVLPHGVLFRGGEEKKIRTNLIEKGHVHAIIGLPANMFFGTGIPTIIMVLRKTREETDTLFVDASKGFVKDGNKNKLRKKDVRKIIETVIERKTIEGFSRKVSKKEIVENDYNLNITRYVDSKEDDDLVDIYASVNGGIPNKEIDGLDEFFGVFTNLKEELFKKKNDTYSDFSSENIEEIIKENKAVKAYINKVKNKLNDLPEFLQKELIENMKKVAISNENFVIYDYLKECTKGIKLIDEYDLFEILSNKYDNIALDLEMIQTEGEECFRMIDEIKEYKKKKKTKELVEKTIGYEGRIFSFDLIETTYFNEEKKEIDKLIEEKESLISQKDELLDSIDPNDKKDILSDDEESEDIDTKKLNKALKGIKVQKMKGAEFDEGSYEDIMIKIDETNGKLTKVKKELNTKKSELEDKVKEKIKNLNKKEVEELLFKKWVEPLCSSLKNIASEIISVFERKVVDLYNKYNVTLAQVEKEIGKVSKELADMIDELTGDEYDMKGLKDFKSLVLENGRK